MIELDGRVTIVTGATRGIGRSTAHAMAGAGARVVIADLPGTALDEAQAAVGAQGEAIAHPVDITDEDSVRALVAHVRGHFGRIDVLVNNAALTGHPADTAVDTLDAEVWDEIFRVIARGTMLVCKHVIPAMVAAGGGSIVNVSSGTARGGQDALTAYGCSKAAVESLTRYVATQYGAQGIRCNAVAPGLVATEALKAGMPPRLQEAVVENKLLGRLGEPDDVARAIRFLASDESAFITGEVLAVDGGYFAHSPSLASQRHAIAELRGG